MVTYKVRLTPRARVDLTNIVEYVRRKESATTAIKVRKGIMEAIKKLQKLPESHAKVEELSDEQIVFRRMLKWDYKIVFTVEKDELVVLVVKIYHGSQNPDAIIEELKK